MKVKVQNLKVGEEVNVQMLWDSRPCKFKLRIIEIERKDYGYAHSNELTLESVEGHITRKWWFDDDLVDKVV